MPISALVITVAGDADRDQLRARLSEMAEIELGPVRACRWPAVVETASLQAGKALVDRVQGLSGVVHVDVLSINFEDLDVGGEAPSGARR